jgi:hypothetical protein
MFEFITTQPDCAVPEAEYVRLLGLPRGHELTERMRELADGARAWFRRHGRPWIYARAADTVQRHDSHFTINGTVFSSRLLREQFSVAPANQAVLVAVSAGPECEEHARALWLDDKPDEYFFLEMFGSAMVEHLIAQANGHICAWADAQNELALPHHSPGYSGWNIAEQIKLWEVVCAATDSKLPGELTVLESGMLRPKKSLLAIVGIVPKPEGGALPPRLVPCETCALPACQFRRAPFQRSRRPALA